MNKYSKPIVKLFDIKVEETIAVCHPIWGNVGPEECAGVPTVIDEPLNS